MEKLSIRNYLDIIKSQNYLYVKTNNFVNSQLYSFFEHTKAPYTPINPIDERKNILVPYDRYIQLISYGVSKQHLKKPIKMYTFCQFEDIYELSGIAIVKEPLIELASLIKQFNFDKTVYTSFLKRNFYLTRLYTQFENTFELGLFKNSEQRVLEKLGYRAPVNLIYFKYNIKL